MRWLLLARDRLDNHPIAGQQRLYCGNLASPARMTIELILFLILPAVLAVAGIVTATYLIIRTHHAVQIVLGAPVIFVSALSLWVLKNMYNGAWPTFLPHLAIGGVCLVVTVQLIVARHSR